MNSHNLISIIIPTYNRAHIIGKTLNSIFGQSYKNWECIVVNDGSTDDTAKVLKPYLEDARFKFISRPSNIPKGPSACRNYGYEHSKGDYIQWFDSDDLMHPEKLKTKIEVAIKNRADVIVDKHDSKEFTEFSSFNIECFTSNDFYIDYLLGKKPVITNDVMLKRSSIGKERFDENLWKGEEYEFFARIFQQKLTYCFCDVVLTRYEVSFDSISISPRQSESLIYLSKKLQRLYAAHSSIVKKAKYQGRKTYKSLILKKQLRLILKHFNFFRKAHHKSAIVFLAFIVYNSLARSGFDLIKPKRSY
tara:strand:- start:20605 stop:21519 length:915 start_codon:yes stop_codon:yes gene_type:complete